eukprot:2624003-Lingulodinium_polyedra.AAC.1
MRKEWWDEELKKRPWRRGAAAEVTSLCPLGHDELREQVIRGDEETDPVSTDAGSESGAPSTISDFESDEYTDSLEGQDPSILWEQQVAVDDLPPVMGSPTRAGAASAAGAAGGSDSEAHAPAMPCDPPDEDNPHRRKIAPPWF